MSKETIIYAFMTIANPEKTPNFINTVVIPASPDELKAEIRSRAKCNDDTEVVFILPKDWLPPHLKSLDQQELMDKFRPIMVNVAVHLGTLGYSYDDTDPGKLINNSFVMPNPVSGRVFFVYKMNKI